MNGPSRPLSSFDGFTLLVCRGNTKATARPAPEGRSTPIIRSNVRMHRNGSYCRKRQHSKIQVHSSFSSQRAGLCADVWGCGCSIPFQLMPAVRMPSLVKAIPFSTYSSICGKSAPPERSRQMQELSVNGIPVVMKGSKMMLPS